MRRSVRRLAVAVTVALAAAFTPSAARSENPTREVPKMSTIKPVSRPAGERYEATVPDTLDLAARAEVALNALTGALDPARSYEIYFGVHFHYRPPVMNHEVSGLPTNNPKFAESLPMMRVMSGSDAHRDIEQGMMAALVSAIGPDGLYYAPAAGRPWHQADPAWNPAKEDFANVYGNGRALLAMMAWYSRDGDPAWAERIDRMADGLARIAIRKDDYAYYPDAKVGESFSYPRSGWPAAAAESHDYNFGVLMYHSGVLRAFAKWYEMRGRPPDLEMARRLARYLLRPGIWGQAAPSRASFGSHFHAHAAALRGLLEYALAAKDAETLEFVQEGYEYARGVGLSSLGWFPETVGGPVCEACCTADMVALAVKLADAGARPPEAGRDYWEDVDHYVRNQLVEQQILRADFLERVSQDGPARPQIDEPRETADRVIERNLGGFAGHAGATILPDAWIMHCCTGNASQALYYAWEGIVRGKGDTAEVNLLLNRASAWVDIDSYLPYQGKVVFRIKQARRLSVRLPAGVEPGEVWAQRDGTDLVPQVSGRRLIFEDLASGETVTLGFPVRERAETFTLAGTQYRARFRGGTAVEISPREESPGGYPTYLRDGMRATHAPMKGVTRYVSPVHIAG